MSYAPSTYYNTLHKGVPLTSSTMYSTLAGAGTTPSGGTVPISRGPDRNAQALVRSKDAQYFCGHPGCPSAITGFTERSSLIRHTKDKHTGKQHKCGTCGAVYADTSSGIWVALGPNRWDFPRDRYDFYCVQNAYSIQSPEIMMLFGLEVPYGGFFCLLHLPPKISGVETLVNFQYKDHHCFLS
ncbi:hypothetical protein CYLTODRAFT_440465 [Cylindrobasidium torrendii FP15055 ss-10]|uniref:C2H2-type domain-containing protein n=1 Tax=Cylindrobasidium torrendii FP15055 ss-10 TaxID=1314674 RepID=A0A0D7BQ25_9AGAR|nr:hypothetical protein CYLTODRAFT_440465 [Cylindrobasidium torrendii FP15055 ss-10]